MTTPLNPFIIPVRASLSDGSERLYSPDEIALIREKNIPKHIGIIPDGNRRWASSKGENLTAGYAKGAYTLIETALAAREIGIEWLTVYSFSTENWKRPTEETSLLIALFEVHLSYYAELLKNAKITLKTIGDISRFPLSLQKTVERVHEITYHDKPDLVLTLALNYGGRDELIRGIKKLIENTSKETLLTTLSEQLISDSLDTQGYPDPDFIIRTSGEKRISNFLLWQSSYSEVYIEDHHWPDFTPSDFKKALVDYQSRERRLGGNSA